MTSPPRRKPSLISRSEVRRRTRAATGGIRIEAGFEDAVIDELTEAFEEIIQRAIEERDQELRLAKKQGIRVRRPSLKKRHVKAEEEPSLLAVRDDALMSQEVTYAQDNAPEVC